MIIGASGMKLDPFVTYLAVRDAVSHGAKPHPARSAVSIVDAPAMHVMSSRIGRRYLTYWMVSVPYVITSSCLDVMDKSCVEECPVDCIYEGDRMMYIQPDECVEC